VAEEKEFSPAETFSEVLEFNADIIQRTRQTVGEVLELAEQHDQIAARYRSIADGLIAAAQKTATLLGDGLIAEMGKAWFDDEGDPDEVTVE